MSYCNDLIINRKNYKRIADIVASSYLSQKFDLTKTSGFLNSLKMKNNGLTVLDLKIICFIYNEILYSKKGFRLRSNQVYAAILLPYSFIEMDTGEGKTLVTSLASLILVLGGGNVNVVTSDEELSRSAVRETFDILDYFGVTCDSLENEFIKKAEGNRVTELKNKVYSKDIVYSTVRTLIFDYSQCVFMDKGACSIKQRRSFCIVDEADSVLVDEATNCFNANRCTEQSVANNLNKIKSMSIMAFEFDRYLLNSVVQINRDLLKMSSKFPGLLSKPIYSVLASSYNCFLNIPLTGLSKQGLEKLQEFISTNNIKVNIHELELYHKKVLEINNFVKFGVHYAIQDNKVVLLDSDNRKNEGSSLTNSLLRNVLEMRSNIPCTTSSSLSFSITVNGFLCNAFVGVSGLSGTLVECNDILSRMHNKGVIRVAASNKRIVASNHLFFNTNEAKFTHMINTVLEIHKIGRPILIIVSDKVKSDKIASLLNRFAMTFNNLNFLTSDLEESIVSMAGTKGTITLATHMAGRGTDIKLTNESVDLGGLFLIQVDSSIKIRQNRQIGGRVGRQGLPGTWLILDSFEEIRTTLLNKNFTGKDIFWKLKSKQTLKMLQEQKDIFMEARLDELYNQLFFVDTFKVFLGSCIEASLLSDYQKVKMLLASKGVDISIELVKKDEVLFLELLKLAFIKFGNFVDEELLVLKVNNFGKSFVVEFFKNTREAMSKILEVVSKDFLN